MKCKFNHLLSMTLMMTLGTFLTPVSSGTVCKGLNEGDCSTNASCIWVNSYVTKQGTEVNSYCRVKQGSKSSASQASSKEHLKQAMQDGNVD